MPTMNTGLGGAAGYGENTFSSASKVAIGAGPNDDASVLVDVTSVFSGGIDFFGSNYTSIYINSNGLITFDGPETAYSPVGLSGYTSPAIAPFWTDIDIDQGGEIYWDLDPSAGTVTVTWLDVRAYSGSSTTNSFQLVLSDQGGGDFDVEFIYEDIVWADGGSGAATAGLTDGGSNDFEVSGSGTSSSVLNWDTTDFDGAGGNDAGVYSVSVANGYTKLSGRRLQRRRQHGPRLHRQRRRPDHQRRRFRRRRCWRRFDRWRCGIGHDRGGRGR